MSASIKENCVSHKNNGIENGDQIILNRNKQGPVQMYIAILLIYLHEIATKRRCKRLQRP